MAASVMAGNNMTNNENRYVRKDGSLVPLTWSARWDPKDRIRYGIARDATERKKNEDALRLSNERFEYAAKATSDILWDWNLVTNEVYYSDNIQSLFGHKPGYNNDNLPFYFDHVHPDDRERVVLYPDQVKYGTMVNWTQEYRFRKACGDYAFVLDRGVVIRDEKGIGVRMIGAMQDITAVKQNELRVLHQNEQLMEIAQINAHEIRRPVATILGLMQFINQNTDRNEADKELLAHLESATKELDEVIRRIIDKTVD
jgi:PAS domain-containing protein